MIKNYNQNPFTCCGCGLCANSCRFNAISMKQDKYGFLFPIVNDSLCVNCHLCEETCRFNKPIEVNAYRKAFICKAKNESICKHSTSGGMYTILSDYVLKSGGVIYAADFDHSLQICHKRICNENERDKSRGSKYVQSDFSKVFENVLEDVKERLVCVFGTPCQIDAIRKFIPEKYCDNIYYVDLICNGVGSPVIWNKHIERLEKKYKHKISSYVFRSKIDGYLSKSEEVLFENGKRKIIDNPIWKYNPTYYSGLITRPSCSNCKYANLNRVSDITIGDYSNTIKNDVLKNTNNGVSTVLVNSEKGNRLFNSIKNAIYSVQISDQSLSDHKRLHGAGKYNQNSIKYMDRIINYGLTKIIMSNVTFSAYLKIAIFVIKTKIARYIRMKGN